MRRIFFGGQRGKPTKFIGGKNGNRGNDETSTYTGENDDNSTSTLLVSVAAPEEFSLHNKPKIT
jgi:hypothetical protein